MSTNFDQIMKKGKSNTVPSHSPEDIWRAYINGVMDYVHRLNDMYPDNDKHRHNLKLDQVSCGDCKQGTYILGIRELNSPDKILRFHKGGWQYFQADSKYYCEKCKKGR